MQQIRGRLWVASLPVATSLLLGACDHSQMPTAEDPAVPAFNFSNGPTTAGPFLVRIDNQAVFFFSADEKKNMLSMHFPLDIAFCGGGSTPNIADAQFVTIPSEVQRILALLKDDDGAVAIYGTADFTEVFGPGGPFSDVPRMCAFMNGPKKIADGTARRVSAFSGNSFSASWTGTLTDVGGNPVRYAEHHVFQIDAKTGVHTIVTSTIQLQ